VPDKGGMATTKRNAGVSPLRFAPVEMTAPVGCRGEQATVEARAGGPSGLHPTLRKSAKDGAPEGFGLVERILSRIERDKDHA
jgi:hypothetical protein